MLRLRTLHWRVMAAFLGAARSEQNLDSGGTLDVRAGIEDAYVAPT